MYNGKRKTYFDADKFLVARHSKKLAPSIQIFGGGPSADLLDIQVSANNRCFKVVRQRIELPDPSSTSGVDFETAGLYDDANEPNNPIPVIVEKKHRKRYFISVSSHPLQS